MCLLLKTEFPHFLLNIIETQSIKSTIGNFLYQTNTTKKTSTCGQTMLTGGHKYSVITRIFEKY